jgi:hypothetical protein
VDARELMTEENRGEKGAGLVTDGFYGSVEDSHSFWAG